MIEQISKDVYRVTTVTDIDVSDLKAELLFRQNANKEVMSVMEWKATLPKDKQKYVIDVPLLDEKEIEAQIKELSGSNI